MTAGENFVRQPPLFGVQIFFEFDGWDQNITQVKSEFDLPKELIDYISFIESFVKVPIKLISVGPDRIQTIYRDK